MEVTFGLWLDGPTWPEHGGAGDASFGAPVVGPAGLLTLLETSFGLTGPAVTVIDRIATWQAKLEAAGDADRFWTASLDADAWATARLTLHWRDALVAAGWSAVDPAAESRLADLASAERAGPELPRGAADRLRAVSALMAAGGVPRLRSVRCIDRRADLPVAWRGLLDLLESRGVTVTRLAPPEPPLHESSLADLQRWLRGPIDLEGSVADGTVALLHAGSVPHAAEVLGQWLEALPEDASVAVIANGGDTHALDLALRRRALPRLGASAPSPYRGSLQVLSLAFQLAWRPVDVRSLLDVLTMPQSPIAPRAAWRLANALERAPGLGGVAWRGAWEAIEAAELDAAGDGPDARRKADARLARWHAWMPERTADPHEGIDRDHAVDICRRVAEWATRRAAGEGDPLYRTTARLSDDVRRAFLASGRDRLSKVWVDRVIDQVLSDGDRDPRAAAEAVRGRRVVPHPGALWGKADVVVWWDFRDAGERPERLPWSADERAELARHGVHLDEPQVAARAASTAWERAVEQAGERLLFVTTGLDGTSDETRHPLAHRLAPALRALARREPLEEALDGPLLDLAGLGIPRVPIPKRALPEQRGLWSTPIGFAARHDGRRESATSLEALFECPMKWALQHVAGVRPGRVRSVPDADRLLGNVAHALAADLFGSGPPPLAHEVEARVAAELDGYLDAMALPLRLEEHSVELIQARRRLPRALATLATTLRENDLVVDAAEHRFSLEVEGLGTLTGFIDLVTVDAHGRPAVVDLKWTRSARRRTEELARGQAVQLAVYGAAAGAAAGADRDASPRAGYFLLRQRRFLTPPSAALRGTPVDDAPDLGETWRQVLDAWRDARADVLVGTLRARGVLLDEDDVTAQAREVHCEWCDYATLCRTRTTGEGAA
jgi:ATP-dependent helicase/nuclease subunit B